MRGGQPNVGEATRTGKRQDVGTQDDGAAGFAGGQNEGAQHSTGLTDAAQGRD